MERSQIITKQKIRYQAVGSKLSVYASLSHWFFYRTGIQSGVKCTFHPPISWVSGELRNIQLIILSHPHLLVISCTVHESHLLSENSQNNSRLLTHCQDCTLR